MNIKRFFKYTLIFLIIFSGLYLRYDSFKTLHPDQDELFELHSLLIVEKEGTFLKRDTFYGDHTSFPGEYLMYHWALKSMDEVKIDVGKMEVEGMTRNDFWKLGSVKITISVLGLLLFAWMCRNNLIALAVFSWNFQVVYHAFEIRPYSVLPNLAIFNLFLAGKKGLWYFLSVSLILFTCTYHAYGILIAGLPLLYYMIEERKIDWILCGTMFLGGLGWMYFASYNTFGITPNSVQSVVDPFQYAPKVKFFENLLVNLTGGSLLFYLSPLLLLRWKKLDWLSLGLMIALPLLLIFAVDLKTSYWIHPRQYVWVIPFFAMWYGNELNGLER